MGNMLIIWEEVPEHTYAYVVPTSSWAGLLAAKCAGKYININDIEGDEINKLNDILGEMRGQRIDVDEQAIIGPFDLVVVCGFMV